MRKLLALTSLVTLAGCASPPAPPVYNIKAPFSLEEAKPLLQAGANTIRGNALWRQSGGGVVTCAGREVSPIATTAYSSERMQALYLSTERGTNSKRGYTFVPNPEEYQSTVRIARCDAQGNFSYDRIPDGKFFIVTAVEWRVGDSPQGGYLMQAVTLSGGQTKTVVLSPN